MTLLNLTLALLIGGCSVQVIFPQKIAGYVKTRAGKPLEGVAVEGERKEASAATNRNGFFELGGISEIIIFDKPGYKPLVHRAGGRAELLEIVLEDDRADKLKIEVCTQSPEPAPGKPFGNRLRIFLPEDIRYEIYWMADVPEPQFYSESDGYFSSRRGHYAPVKGRENFVFRGGVERRHFWGEYAGIDTIRKSPIVSVRAFGSDDGRLGLDWRGKTEDGFYWRSLSGKGHFEHYFYYTDSRRMAEKFDEILDRVCFRN